MGEPWSLDYEHLKVWNTVLPVDEQAIKQTLQRLGEAGITSCGLTNLADHCWLGCRGDRDQHLVEYVSSPVAYAGDTGVVASRIFFLARKQPVDRRAAKIRWQSDPAVFVDVRADAILSLPEILAVFTTYFSTGMIHHDFTTIPKPRNGYL